MLEFVFPWLFLLLPLPLLLRFLPEYLQQNQMVKVPFFNKLIEISGDKAKLGAKTQLHTPEQSGHRFRHYPDTLSVLIRTPIPG
jgi:hypothetical protein